MPRLYRIPIADDDHIEATGTNPDQAFKKAETILKNTGESYLIPKLKREGIVLLK